MKKFLNYLLRCDNWMLLLIWAAATSVNLTKAVHMDDPVYLYSARAILETPFRPYNAQISWGAEVPGPLSDSAQPPLLFYGFASILALFGESEVALHAFMSLFTLGVILGFYRITSRFDRQSAILATCLLCLGPAFMPSQNLMTDVPVLFFHLLCFWILTSDWSKPASIRRIAAAGVAAASAVLTKYVGLVLVLLIPIAVLLRGPRRILWSAAIPAVPIAAWTLFSYYSNGKVHFLKPALTSGGSSLVPHTIDWFTCLGSIAPFSLLFLPAICSSRPLRAALLGFFAVALIWHPNHLNAPAPSGSALHVAARVFFWNGVFTSVVTLWTLLSRVRRPLDEQSASRLLASAWFIGSFIFIVTFAPFIAVRHLLLVMPVVVLSLADGHLQRVGTTVRLAAAAVTLSLGLLVAHIDRMWAEVYRSQALELSNRFSGPHTLWAVGHWGWQWYAEKCGMNLYNWNAEVRDGDYLLVPTIVNNHGIRPNHLRNLVPVGLVSAKSNFLIPLKIMSAEPWGGFYASTGNSIPLRLNDNVLESISVFQYRDRLDEQAELPLELLLSSSTLPHTVIQGFHSAEPWGRWSSAEESSLNFSQLLPAKVRLVLRLQLFRGEKERSIVVRAGSHETHFTLNQPRETIQIDLQSDQPFRSLTFVSPPLVSVETVSNGLDRRMVGFGLESLEISPLPSESEVKQSPEGR